MRTTCRLAFVLGLWLLAPDAVPLAAQTAAPGAGRWQLTLEDERYVWDVRLVELVGDTLIVRQSDSLVRTPLAHINELRRFRETTLRVGDVHTSALDALAGDIHDVYDLAGLPVAERRSAIRGILAQRQPRAN